MELQKVDGVRCRSVSVSKIFHGVFSVCTTLVYKMMFPLLVNFVESIRSCAEIHVLNTYVFKRITVHMRRAYRGSSSRQATHMLDTITSLQGNRKGEPPTIFFKIGRNLQDVVHRKTSRCMKDGGIIAQQI